MIGTIDDKGVGSVRVREEAGRKAALEVLGATYRNEKGWVSDPAHQFPAGDLERHDTAWFVVHLDGRPVGVLRTLFEPPLHAPPGVHPRAHVDDSAQLGDGGVQAFADQRRSMAKTTDRDGGSVGSPACWSSKRDVQRRCCTPGCLRAARVGRGRSRSSSVGHFHGLRAQKR